MRNLSARLIDRRAFVAGALALASSRAVAGPLDPLGGGGCMLFDDFTQGPQGLLSGRRPLIGPQWIEKDNATSEPAGNPGHSIITADGLTCTCPPVCNGNGCFDGAAWNVLRLSDTPGEVGFSFTLLDNMVDHAPTAAVWRGGEVWYDTGCLHIQVLNKANQYLLKTATREYVPGSANGVVEPTSAFGPSETSFGLGSVYIYRCLIDGDWSLNLIYDAAGRVLAHTAIYCAGVSKRLGPWFFLQTFTGVTYKSVWARRRGATGLNLAF